METLSSHQTGLREMPAWSQPYKHAQYFNNSHGIIPISSLISGPRSADTPSALVTWNTATSHESDPETAQDYLCTQYLRALNAVKKIHRESVGALEAARAAPVHFLETQHYQLAFQAPHNHTWPTSIVSFS